MTGYPAVLTELAHLRGRLPELSGSVLATTDGMVLAHDAHGIEPDSLAALAAAHLALSRRFAYAVGHGDLRESVVQCTGGYVTSYTAGPDALLTIVTGRQANLALVHLEARRCVQRIVDALAETGAPVRPQRPPVSASTALARRTPMATMPSAARRRKAAG